MIVGGGGAGLSRPPNKPRAGNGVTLRNTRQLRGTAVSLDGHLMHVQLEALHPPAPSPRRHGPGVGAGKGAVHMSLDLSRIPTLPQLPSVPSSERAWRARAGASGREDWGTGLEPYSSPRQKKPRVPPPPSTWQPQPPPCTHATRTPRDVEYVHTPHAFPPLLCLADPCRAAASEHIRVWVLCQRSSQKGLAPTSHQGFPGHSRDKRASCVPDDDGTKKCSGESHACARLQLYLSLSPSGAAAERSTAGAAGRRRPC